MLLLLLSLTACDPSKTQEISDSNNTVVAGCDEDGDGFCEAEGDCNEGDASVYPGATETCNNLDDNCNGTIDDGALTTFYNDSDGDGYGDPENSISACELPTGYVTNDTDCDDSQARSFPGNPEVCDGLDNNCDLQADEGVGTLWYADADGDGYGDPLTPSYYCTTPPNASQNGDDCDDSAATAFPGNLETCDLLDNNCDGRTDEGVQNTYYVDTDGDGYGSTNLTQAACVAPAGYVSNTTDCNDTQNTIYPGATEYCNQLDDDCDGSIDETGIDASIWYIDQDGDGYGSGTSTQAACNQPNGYAATSTDCDDRDATVYPLATETCDNQDNNCDGVADEGVQQTFYADLDLDTYGDPTRTIAACSAPYGYTSNHTDCNDTRASTYPGAPEYCNSFDDDCDGQIDEAGAVDATTWYIDNDNDGVGSTTSTQTSCNQPAGYAASSNDCNDSNPAISPNAAELCNSIDDDCDTLIDEANASDATTWYRDSDGDGYGLSTSSQRGCSQPVGYVANSTDCNDGSAVIHPGASELCDTIDQDCDGDTRDPESTDALRWYQDNDADGYGNPNSSTLACTVPYGYAGNSTDCNDNDAAISPNDLELCNGVDDDCDGQTDEADAFNAYTWYRDVDGDGYGISSNTQRGCNQPAGYVASGSDCNDSNTTIHPNAAEYCDTTDQDCDGETYDYDSVDAFVWYSDSDGDGFGDPAGTTTTGCTQPAGYTDNTNDCDDTDGTVYPESHEIEVPGDGIDQDCDGQDVCYDLNCDGWPDVVIANEYDGSVFTIDSYVYWGSGTGYSSSNRLSLPTKGAYRVKVEDINNDGWQDVLFIDYNDGNASADSYLYWGSINGLSTSNRTAMATIGALDACIDDLDGDGYKDIVFAGYYSGTSYSVNSYLYWGSASGYSSTDRSSLPTIGARSCATSDLDGDGLKEVVFSGYNGGSTTGTNYIYWASSAGYSTADRTTLSTGRSAHVYVDDIDEDGYPDILLPVYYDGDYNTNSEIFWGNGSTYSTANHTQLSSVGVWSAAIVDVDLDGHKDIAFSSVYSGSTYTSTSNAKLWYGSTNGFSSANRTSLDSRGSYMVSSYDTNLDGYPELIMGSYREGTGTDYVTTAYDYVNTAGTFSTGSRTSFSVTGNSEHAVGDLNNDGYPEIVFINRYSGSTFNTNSTIYWGASTGYSSSNTTSLPTSGPWGAPVIVGAYDQR